MTTQNDGQREQRSRKPAEPGLEVFLGPREALVFGHVSEVPATQDPASNKKGDYEEYKTTCERIRLENVQLLDGFVALLNIQRLAPGTIRKHRENVDFFINEFLLYNDTKRPSDGISEIGEYFGDWFIRKAMWSTPRTIKTNAVSLYKFYAFLAALDKVTPADLAGLKTTIALHLPDWQNRCERYNNVEIDDWREDS